MTKKNDTEKGVFKETKLGRPGVWHTAVNY